jgi:hypothetical protein
VIVLAMRRKPIALAAGVLAVIGGALTLQHIPQRFFPFAERDQFVVDVWLPEGWKVEATDSAVRRIEAVLRHEKEVVNYTSFVGSSAPRFYYNVNPQLPDKNYAQLLVATTSAEVTPKAGGGAAPEARAGRARSPRLPSGTAAGAGPGSGHRNPAHGEDDKVLRVLGQSGGRTGLAHSGRARRSQRLARGCLSRQGERPRGGCQPLGFTNATHRPRNLPGGFEGGRSRPIGKAIAM